MRAGGREGGGGRGRAFRWTPARRLRTVHHPPRGPRVVPTVKERLLSAAIGLALLLVSLAVAAGGFLLLPPSASGLEAFGVGLLVLLGLTGALGALFLLLLPALLPVR